MKYGVELVISAIILVLILFVTGHIIRKKYYREIDRLETKKLELMNLPVAEEMAKVKSLNMTGQTERMFERWRQTWDDILAVQLPNIDEMLFDSEEYSDKYRFNKAKETNDEIEKTLGQIENRIQQIMDELKELVGSEEKNREEIEGLLEIYRSAKKELLAHRHTYGPAADKLEELLESAADKIGNYEALTGQGDYLEAREVVLALAAEMETLMAKMDKIPDFLTECHSVLPSQKKELEDGYNEMKEQGFKLDHLQIEKQLEQLDKELDIYAAYIRNAEVEEVEGGLHEVKESLDMLYDMLEKEVYAKHYVMAESEKTGFVLEKLKDVNEEIKGETDAIQHSYQLMDNELGIPKNFDKTLSQLTKRYDLLKAKISEEQSAYSLLSEELKTIESQLSDLQEEQSSFSERLQNLRKDELDARDKVAGLQRKVNEIIRMVRKSRLPGLPGDCESLLEQAEERIGDVYQSLEEKPLNMKSVQKFLYEAEDTVDHLYSRTEEHVENARFAEVVIQYGNRYRGRNPELRMKLDKAERAFRSYEYKAALEQAATAVEEVEPGALKRIEQMLEEEIHV
ncbi:MAG TPA: septation ring formation regulator EzrA [Bacillaceae bacterium]